MKIVDIDQRGSIFSHWILNSKTEIVKAVAETPEWKDSRKMYLGVFVNGVELDAEDLESFLLEHTENVQKKIEEKYSDLDAEVERRVEEKMKGKRSELVDKFQEAINYLDTLDFYDV